MKLVCLKTTIRINMNIVENTNWTVINDFLRNIRLCDSVVPFNILIGDSEERYIDGYNPESSPTKNHKPISEAIKNKFPYGIEKKSIPLKLLFM